MRLFAFLSIFLILPFNGFAATQRLEAGENMPETATYEYDQFFEMSGLAKFDKNLNGLSAQEFIGTPFQKLDDDDNNMINMEEWKEAYMESVTPANA